MRTYIRACLYHHQCIHRVCTYTYRPVQISRITDTHAHVYSHPKPRAEVLQGLGPVFGGSGFRVSYKGLKV